jgi:HAE1 family hydrophobic/amphiphilic exporter-1
MVIFLFLRNVSATLIPGAAVPFSIIGTFAVMYLLGYSLNNLSLMALTLSVGFVVDDAIVMLENIVRHMEMGKTRRVAAIAAAHEIGFTIISMTLSLVAVFIPVLFLGGIVGRLLHEFSVTIVVAILISGFVSLTLTPMLGSRFLKSEHETRHGWFYHLLESGFNGLTRWYEVTLRIALRFRLVTLALAVLMLFGTGYLFFTMPTGFIPSQDSGFTFGVIIGPQDISFDSMAQHLRQVSAVLQADPNTQTVGAFGGTGAGGQSNQSFVFVNMKPRPAQALGGSVHRIAAAQTFFHPRRLHVHAEPAADHRERPVQHQRLSAHAAESQSARHLHVGSAADGENGEASRLRGRQRQ